VAKPILIASWKRTGVPADIAEYLVAFDTDGYTYVGTPYTRNINQTQGTGGFSITDPTKTPCFQAVVGTGQGDVASPFNWNAFFDILLCALDTVSSTPFYVRGEEHVLHPTEDTGYADDLISVSACIDGLQDKADLVSAFSIIFGLDIAVQKLRAVQIHWGSENPHADTNTTIIVHKDHWQTTTHVPLLSHNDPLAKPIKYLGVLFDYDNTGRSQLALTKLQIQTDFRSLQRKYTKDPLLKIEVALASILSKARFAAKFCSWSLREMEDIDTIFSSHYRKILSLPPTFATELIYAPKNKAGTGIQRFSDAVNSDKLSLLYRALSSTQATRTAISGLLSRAHRASGIHPASGEAAIIPICWTSSNNTLWASSLIHWLAIAGLSISSGGASTQNTGAERFDSYCNRHDTPISSTIIHDLNNMGLRTISDVSRPSPAGQIWARSDFLPGIDNLPSRFDQHPPPSTPPQLKPQQSWSLFPYTEVIEPLG
jgi:hypothetical protein